MNGSAVLMPWASRVKAILEAWLSGQAGGEAIADAIVGRSNPSGKLSETFPGQLEDTPAFLDFPGQGEARYGERVFIGYRYYERRQLNPLFPVGHGRSYTTFGYSNLELAPASAAEAERGVLHTASVRIRNTGSRSGKEVVQLYVGERQSRVQRPLKELRHFAKVSLEAAESRQLRFELRARDFAYYDVRLHDWVVELGQLRHLRWRLLPGSTARRHGEARGRAPFPTPQPPLDAERLRRTPAHPSRLPLAARRPGRSVSGTADAAALTPEKRKARDMAEAFLSELPVWKLPLMSQGTFSEQQLEELLALAG